MPTTCRTTADTISLPSSPTGLVLNQTDHNIILDWSEAPSDESITSWKVYRSTNQGGPFSLLATVTVSTKTDSTAVSGTIYHYRVSAVNAQGEGSYSEVSGVFTTDSTAPGEVTITSGPTQVGATAVSLTWTQPIDSDFAGAKVYAKQDSGSYALASGSGLVVGTVFNHTAATAGHDWTYKITTVDVAANESTGVVSSPITIPGSDSTAPAAPTGVAAQARSDGILVTWDANVEYDLASYKVYQDGTTLVGTITQGDPTSYLDTTAVEAISHYYTVKALDMSTNLSTASSNSNTTARLAMGTYDLLPFLRSGAMVPCTVHARGIDYRRYTSVTTNNISTITLTETLDITGVAPLAAGTLLTTNYAWNFAAGGGQSKGLFPVGKGFNYAHAYDVPGHYDITLTRTDQAGKSDLFQATVSLAQDTRTIIYCSPNGSNLTTNNGQVVTSPVSPARAQVLLNASANLKVRLQNGTTFNSSGILFTLSKANQMLEGWSFSQAPSSSPPVIQFSSQPSGFSTLIDIKSTATDAVIQNISISGYASDYTRGIQVTGPGALIRNVSVLKAGRLLILDEGTRTTRYLLVQGCISDSKDGLNEYFCFVTGQDLVFLGNRAQNSNTAHPVRCSQYSRILFAYNNFTNMDRKLVKAGDDVRTAMNCQHGVDIYHYQNTYTADITNADASPTTSKQEGALAIGPLRDGGGKRDEYLKNIVVEGNRINAKIDIQSGATDVMIRNNIIDRPDSKAIQYDGLSGNDAAGLPYNRPCARIYVYNNTIRNGGKTGTHIMLGSTVDNFELINNHLLATTILSTNSNSAIILDLRAGFGSGNKIERNCCPSQDTFRISSVVEQIAVLNQRTQASGGLNIKEATSVDTNFKPASNSTCATHGRPKPGVFDDLKNTARSAKALTWTCGAYQL